jgi:predicted nucleic-acid-binding protein
MIGLDTNVLARYYIYDGTNAEAKHQRLVAQRLIDSGRPLAICKTVIIELEWVMRQVNCFLSFYKAWRTR